MRLEHFSYGMSEHSTRMVMAVLSDFPDIRRAIIDWLWEHYGEEVLASIGEKARMKTRNS